MLPLVWSKRIVIVLIVLALALSFDLPQVGTVLAQSENDRLTLAFYYTWFDENTWSPSQVPDMPTRPYRSRDRATIERHVVQAQASGIDAFVASWWGPQEENNQTETNLSTLLDVAQAQGFYATVDFELTSPFYTGQADIVAALRHLLDTHVQHPAFLRYSGKPVIFFWRQQNYDIATWAALRQQVDPTHTTLWIAEGVDLAYQDVFDGHHLYNITWNPFTDPVSTATKFSRKIDEYNIAHGTDKLWIATVMPGYDDTHISGRPGAYAYPRQDGNYYRHTWEAAIASNPDMIVITSFNEWREGTMIEPSVTYGDLFLNLTRELSSAYRQGTTLLPTATVAPTSTPLPAPTATLTPSPTITPTLTPSPTFTTTPSPTPTFTPSPTATPTLTPSPTSTPTLTPSPTFTTTPSPTSSATPSPTPSHTPSSLPSSTWAPTTTTATTPPPQPSPDKGNKLCLGAMLLPLAVLGMSGFGRMTNTFIAHEFY